MAQPAVEVCQDNRRKPRAGRRKGVSTAMIIVKRLRTCNPPRFPLLFPMNPVKILLLSALAFFFWSAGGTALHAADSSAKFVQDFYNWYVPLAKHDRHEASSDVALKKRSADFSPELTKALKEDSAAAAKNPGEIVGLDFDPFLNSQEAVDRSVVGNTTEKNGAFRVEVYHFLDGKKDKKPQIIAEVKSVNGHWVFVNFWNSDKGNLLDELRQLAKDRKKYHAK